MSGAYVSLAVGINALTGGGITDALGMGGGAGGGGSRGGAAAQQAVDPFTSYRGKLGQMYSGYLTGGDQTDITKMPGYSQFQKGVMNPALEASKRSSAASGMLRSGNEQIALQDIGQRGYYGFMTDYLNRLATGSGAGYAPAQGGQAGISQGNLQDQAFMQGLGGTAQALSQIYNRSQPIQTGYTGTPYMTADQNTLLANQGSYYTQPLASDFDGFV
jgi:hypothetical protein